MKRLKVKYMIYINIMLIDNMTDKKNKCNNDHFNDVIEL